MLPSKQKIRRQGVTAIETLVSFTLLATVLGVTAPLLVRHNRLLADERVYRQAVDTLGNQIDRLQGLSGEDLLAAIDRLPAVDIGGGRLVGRIDRTELGQRITLAIEWPGEIRRRPTISLVGWSFAKVADQRGGGSS